MYKSYKFRMYPNEETRSQINNTFGSTRFTYNYYLTKIKEDKFKLSKTIIDTKSIIKDINTNLKNAYPFLKEIDNNLIIKTIYQLSDNYKKYSTNNFGYPKYRSKYQRNSFTITSSNIEVNLKTKKVTLDMAFPANLSSADMKKLLKYADPDNLKNKYCYIQFTNEKNEVETKRFYFGNPSFDAMSYINGKFIWSSIQIQAVER